MSEPLIFIFTVSIKEGKLDGYETFLKKLGEFLQANEPRLIAQEVYVNEDGTEATAVLVQPDADSMEFHLQLLADWSYEEFLDTKSIEVYGKLSDALLAMFSQYAEWGVPVTFKRHLSGFNRFPALSMSVSGLEADVETRRGPRSGATRENGSEDPLRQTAEAPRRPGPAQQTRPWRGPPT